jgi:hypothetical protein
MTRLGLGGGWAGLNRYGPGWGRGPAQAGGKRPPAA